MGLLLSAVIGLLFATGFYLLMSSNLLRLVFGFSVISQAVNLFVFSTGGLTLAQVPIIRENEEALLQGPDALAQALILTAIVIGFAATAFLIVLVRQSSLCMDTDNVDEMTEAER